MYEVRFVNVAGHFGPFRDQATAHWWATHECNGKTALVVPVTLA